MGSIPVALLEQHKIEPVLVDIGASGSTPAIWREVARYSTYIGFDPDRRDFQTSPAGRFKREILIDKAVVADEDATEVTVYLTKSPYCSSTLRPDPELLQEYEYSDLFEIEREVTVDATTLDSVVGQHGLPSLDWIKLDTQGTDLRILNSIDDQIKRSVLAVDVEPELSPTYVGEDVFGDTHDRLTSEDFWLAELKPLGTVRIGRPALDSMLTTMRLGRRLVTQILKKSPCWCEASYLRTIGWMRQHDLGEREHILLWLFSLLQDQVGFAFDVALEYERRFGSDDTSEAMRQEVRARILKKRRKQRLRSLLGPLGRPVLRFLR